jgi:small subunit ribosomal protein S9
MKQSNVQTSGKRKTAVARALIRKGTGKVIINRKPIEVYTPLMSRDKILEPVILMGADAENFDIFVTINGGGITSQADAARVAIGRAISEFTKDKRVKEMFKEYDWQLLVSDVRRKESAKPNRHGQARAKRQKSYR